MASENMRVAALGRPFTIGMLYDARKDELIPGLTLWDEKTLRENTVENSQPFSAFDISASDSIESKSSMMDIDASLKASFLGGLIQVGGSAEYLNDTKKFKNQSRVTLQYKATTGFKQLSVTTLETTHTQHIDVTKIGSATHGMCMCMCGIWSRISAGLVGEVQDIFENLRELKMRCNDSLDDRVANNFPHIRHELRSFKKLCDYYESNLKQTMAMKFPLIREGKEIESSAEQLLEVGNKPLFSHEKLSKWLDHKEREINVIRSCVDMMEGTKIVPNQSDLDREVLAPDVDHALCFVFTSLESADPRPDAMANLDSVKSASTNEVPWYYSDDVLIKMREKAGSFQDLAQTLKNNSRVCFLLAAIANEKYTGATIYHYKNGILVTDDFSKPNIPPVKTIRDRRDLIWYACDLTLDPNTANNCLTLSEQNKKATYGASHKYPDHPERFDTHPQVLCKEGLTGLHYWEVEWSNGSNESVYIAVAYSAIERKANSVQSELGNNILSWCFGQKLSSQQHVLRAYHDGQVWEESFPFTGWKRVGVFLDWCAGTLSFYRVSANTLSHIYTFHTMFSEPLYPGFWVGNQSNYAYLPPFV